MRKQVTMEAALVSGAAMKCVGRLYRTSHGISKGGSYLKKIILQLLKVIVREFILF